MNVLILTSTPFVRFIVDEILSQKLGHKYLVRHSGEYDWSEDYDIGISFMYPYKVPADQLHKTRINFHPGPLPEYKGRNLCYHAIMNGEKEFGATVHYMDENFDTGRIIEVSHFPIDPAWCADELSAVTIEEAKTLFQEYLPRILAGEEFHSSPNVGGTYYSKQEIDEFISVSKSTQNQIRAISYENFVPKININGRIFKVVRE